MLLAIEQGNTNTLFAVHDGERWIAQWRTSTVAARTADEYAAWLNQLLDLQGLGLKDLDDCIISSVVPHSLFNLRNFSRRYVHAEPLVVGHNVQSGFEARVANPAEVGADRLVNAVGAHVCYPGALLVVDSGTATTFDVIAPRRGVRRRGHRPGDKPVHRGVAQRRRDAAARGHSPAPARHRQGHGFPGAMWPWIEGLVERTKAEYGQPMTVIGTGGVGVPVRGRRPRPSIGSTRT